LGEDKDEDTDADYSPDNSNFRSALSWARFELNTPPHPAARFQCHGEQPFRFGQDIKKGGLSGNRLLQIGYNAVIIF
jgi:hypothetical protein